MNKKRELYFFKDYFEKFYERQTEKVQKKILWTLRIIEELEEFLKRGYSGHIVPPIPVMLCHWKQV
jgi:hypothetical protein